ncbi:methyltransferase domain-containing protein [Corallococcus sp. ZKHCc1 1396]|uniref:Methyltransferase domain-containing protein n=1 Tax=Corallococcus soli TaxID=2710757 RepID=A0ABR9PVB6_9BACT|nr:methyltransferase domain-containing protein [Corallococcus sp. BB11-1]MBE4751858.1 methyltransferase domain-containing protein [Corallococcus soli]MCY1034566.1 methyltransferase domain-containing protein [Corallococcus sp. BB11-1]
MAFLYAGQRAGAYEAKLPGVFNDAKADYFRRTGLRRGDRVLVVCCGSGKDLPFLMEKVGPEGHILGVDFSDDMLALARERVEKAGWRNVELKHADVTRFNWREHGATQFDAGVCTLGLSIIPHWQEAYQRLWNSVRPGGLVLVGDMQLATGWKALFNPLTVWLSRDYGGSHEGHHNAGAVFRRMHAELERFEKAEYMLSSYGGASGVKRVAPLG